MFKKKSDSEIDLDQLVTLCDENEYTHPGITLCKDIGAENWRAVMREYGGQKPHIPTEQSFCSMVLRDLRNEKIRRLFHPTQYGYAQLAKEFSNYMGLGTLSERQVREIVHAKQRTYKRKPENYKPVKLHQDMHGMISGYSEDYEVPMAAILQAIIEIAGESHDLRAVLDKRFGRQTKMDMAS